MTSSFMDAAPFTTEVIAEALSPAPRVAPASFGQASLWFLRQLMPYPSAYNTAVELRLQGELDEAALLAAVREVVRRHESFRTTFTTVEGTVFQVVTEGMAADVTSVDLTSTPEPEAEARRLARAAAAAPFDLARGPLLRVRLHRLAPQDHALVVVMDHIIADGTSLGILWREIGALYCALPLPPPANAYGAYVEAQRRWLQTPAFARQLDYWTSRLAGAPACELPTDRPRPPVRSYRGDLAVIDVPAPMVARLRAVAAEADVSLFACLLAGLDVLLARWSGQSDIVVLIPVAGRQRFAADAVIGYFANMVVLRTEVPDGMAFRALAQRVNKEILGGVFRQDVPFAKVIEARRPDRSLGDDPLARISLSFFAAPGSTLSLPGVQATYREIPNGGAKFDLSLIVTERADDLTVSAEYNTDLYDAPTVERLLECLRTLLDGIGRDPAQPIDDLPLLPPEEARRLLALGGGVATFPVDACLHQLFQAQAARTPSAVALTFEAASVTYAELDRRARLLARALRRRGVGPETLVGLAVDRGVDLVVAILGILAAGGAYLPLDPDYPRARLAFMIADARVPLVVTSARHAHLFEAVSSPPTHPTPKPPGPELLQLDADAESIAAESGPDDPVAARPEHLAYVIYTSGSTGNPKGVMVEHRQVVRLFHATDAWYRFHAGDVWTMFHSYAFDFSVWEIWGALLYGGRLVIVPRPVARSPDAFYRLLVDERVTVLNQTPSAFRQLVDVDGSVDAATRSALALRYVIFGGEALRVSDLEPFWQRHGDERPALVNMYGITETTVHVTYRPLRRADLERPWSSVIGVPIPDLSIHVLDARRRPVPIGVPGELYVGGAGVARGYLQRPELTAERFLDDPTGAAHGSRLYRTGDRARRLDGGDVEYLGRIDHQVKIRGFRVELGEIEAALAQHPAVREAVVVPREDRPGELRLVAYLVPKAESTLDAAALRAFLAERLLEPMVPAAFVALAALPLTSNGKLDRHALPAPDDGAIAQGAYVAPRTPAEELLAGIWADLLGLERVSVTADFFALGGHSLLGMRVIARLSAAFGVALPVRALFEARTVAGLAERLAAAGSSGERSAVPPIAPRGVSDADPPLSFAQQRLWFLDQLEPDSPLYNLPEALRCDGPLDVGALERSFAEIVRRHEALRTTFVKVEGVPRQVIAREASFSLPVVDLSALPEAEREAEAQRFADADAQRPFDLARGPLFRVTLLKLAADVHVVVRTVHHIVSDGWSDGVLATELSALYTAFVASHDGGGPQTPGLPSPLPPLPVQVADHAVWQRAVLTNAALRGQIDYWKEKLRGAPAAIDLPADRPRPPLQTTAGRDHPVRFSRELVAGLTALSRREGVTLFMTLLAAFQVLLKRTTGQDDVVVGSPIAGRTRPEMEGLIGFFVNTLVLRTDLGGDPTLRDLLARVREVTLDAYAHQDVPFEKLVEALSPPRDLSRTPLFQAMLILQNAPAASPSLGVVASRRLPVERGTSKFDLTVVLEETHEGLVGFVEYATALFDEATIARLVAHLQILLEGAVADPTRRISELPLLTAAEQQALASWNATGHAYPADALLHELFAAQAARTPAAPALRFEGREVSYGELDRRSNQLAHALRKRGVGPDTLVGVLMERSVEMVVALYAVLKAGGAYVPLDPEYPRERLAFMLEDARAPVILIQAHLASVLPEQGGAVVRVDTDWEAIAREPGEAPPRDGLTLKNLAYVIYTSGSTGRPKGAMNEHGGILNRLQWMQRAYGLTAADRVLQKTPYSFDVSVWEFFWPLMVGASLVVARPQGHRDPAYLSQLIGAEGVTTLHFVPSMLAAFLDVGALDRCGSLRRVVCSGEALPASLADRFFARLPGVALDNLYGPTEAAVDVTAWSCTPGAPGVPIGRPIDNVSIHIVDEHLAPVPIGVSGELYIGGVQVGRGYLNRPELTQERFVRDPFAGEGGRLYRTGDVARWLPSGAVEYLGRADFQVKVRGFRIELGEIEAVLESHPSVQRAVVLAREDTPGDKRLVAYLVFRDGDVIGAGELHLHAAARLPEHMVPLAFLALDAIPLTASGKVDRRALKAPGVGGSDGSIAPRTFTPPRDDIEAKLAAIFRNVLGLPAVGLTESFFDLGGHSLLAVRLVAEIERVFGRTISLVSFFRSRTVEQIAALLRADGAEPASFMLEPIQPNGAKRPFFLISRPNVNSLGYIALARHLDPDRPVYGLQYQYAEEVDLGRPYTYEEYQAWATSYVETIRLIQPEGPYLLGGMCEGALIAFTMARVLEAAGQRVALLAMLDAWPQENTNRRVLHHVHVYERRARELWVLRRDEQLRLLRRAVAGALTRLAARTVLRPRADAAPPSSPPSPWDARIFPGPSFVPPQVDARIAVFRLQKQPYWRIRDEQLGWGSRTRGGVEVHIVPGEHGDLLREPDVATTGRTIDACLRRADP